MNTFSDETIQEVWDRLPALEGINPNLWKQDFAGAWIRRDFYGLTNDYGWEIDHLRPLSRGGGNNIENLNAIHWQNNRSKAANFPEFTTVITSDGTTNVYRERRWRYQE